MKTYTQGNKNFGTLEGKNFTKVVKHSKHHLHNFSSWGIDQQVLDDLPQEAHITIKDTENGHNWLTTVDKWRKMGWSRNMGFGDQYLLHDRHFKKMDFSGNVLQEPYEAPRIEIKPENQPKLF